MIYFITNDEATYSYFKEKCFLNISPLRDNDETFSFYKNWAAKKYVEDDLFIGFDKETNGLDAFVADTILDIIGDKETQFVIHSPHTLAKRYIYYIKRKFTIIGHNIKFDIKFCMAEHQIRFNSVYDTMIAEQRIYMKSGFRFALAELLIRYLDIYPDSADKKIREEWVDKDVSKFKLEPRHIYYAAGDVEHLFEIKDKQEKLIDKYDLNFLLYNIEFPLINILAIAENEGWDFDKESWLDIYNVNVENRFKIECKLDDEVRRLRNESYSDIPEKKMYMVGGKWDNDRKRNLVYNIFNNDGTTNMLNLFGEPMKVNTLIGSKAKEAKKINKMPNNINYESPDAIIEIFGRLEEPLLTKKEELIIPTFRKNGKINKLVHSFSTSENTFIVYKSMLPNSRMIPFIDLLLEHRGLSNSVNNFGANFINKINPVTGKLHTIFRQANAVTGRMQSGGGRLQPDKYNAQNIPSRSSYAVKMRNCFRAPEGYSIGTHDYSGAELIVMCSISQDMKLLEISKNDIHSYVAQYCWRNIYKARAYMLINKVNVIRSKRGSPTWIGDGVKDLIVTINDLIKKSKSYIVTKETERGKIRTSFKPMTFKEKFVSLHKF